MRTTTLLLAVGLALAGVAALAPTANASDGCVTHNTLADFCSPYMECPGYMFTIWLLGQPQDYHCA